jgi:hypothetical protein
MAAPEEVTTAAPPAPEAFTIADFCIAHTISPSFYFKLRSQGLGPDETRLGTRVIITKESAAAWRAARTAESAA